MEIKGTQNKPKQLADSQFLISKVTTEHEYKAIVIKTMCYWHMGQTYKHIGELNRTDCPEINPYTMVNDFQQGCQDRSTRKRTIFSMNGTGTTR